MVSKMVSKNVKYAVVALVIALAAFVGISTALPMSVVAAPAAVERAVPGWPGAVQVVNTASVATTDTTFTAKNWLNYSTADVFIRVTMGTVNTTTFVLQTSPDYTTWFTHTYLFTPTASAFYVGRINASGAYYRIVAYGTSADTFTPTIKVVLK